MHILNKNRVAKIFGVEKPVVQAPLMWLTNAKLVASVGNAGGLGVLGPNAGQRNKTTSPIETAERMRREIHKVRELSDKPFAVNILPVDPKDDIFTPPMLKVLYEEKVPVVSYVGDIYPKLFEDILNHGIKIIYRDLNPNVKSAQLAEKLGASVVVATGFDEGGTLPNKVIGTFSVVPMIVDAVHTIPVLAAGGIVDKRTAKAAVALGAEGTYSGTVFLSSYESPMSDNIKEELIESKSDDLLLFRTEPAYYRSLPGKLSNELIRMNNKGDSRSEIYKAMGGLAGIHKGMLDGNTDEGYVSLSTSISGIKKIRTTEEIVNDLNSGIVG